MRNPKSILITGGSSGIGEALCLSCAAPGVHIAFSGRDEQRVSSVAQKIMEKGAEVDARVLDVTDSVAMKNWIEEVDNRTPLDLVFANAGVGTPDKELQTIHDSTQHVFSVNVNGVLNTVHPALIRMVGRGRGQIAIMSSIAGYMGLGNSPAYSASKAAVKAYGRALRTRYSCDGIEISVICPGWILTRINEEYREKIPFFVSMDYGVRYIRRGLELNRGLISFPPSLRFLLWWMSGWPDRVVDWAHPKILR